LTYALGKNTGMTSRIISLQRRDALDHKTSSTMQVFIEEPVPRQESGRSWVYDFRLDFKNFSDRVVVFVFLIVACIEVEKTNGNG
jgi:hypothetical protein